MDSGTRVAVVGGFVLLALLFPIFLASGLIVPTPAVPVFVSIWVVAVAVALRRRDQPFVVLAAPVVALIVLVVGVSLGEWLFNWSA